MCAPSAGRKHATPRTRHVPAVVHATGHALVVALRDGNAEDAELSGGGAGAGLRARAAPHSRHARPPRCQSAHPWHKPLHDTAALICIGPWHDRARGAVRRPRVRIACTRAHTWPARAAVDADGTRTRNHRPKPCHHGSMTRMHVRVARSTVPYGAQRGTTRAERATRGAARGGRTIPPRNTTKSRHQKTSRHLRFSKFGGCAFSFSKSTMVTSLGASVAAGSTRGSGSRQRRASAWHRVLFILTHAM